MVIFGDRLKLLRNRKGLSQAEFAKQIGVSKSSVNMYERGDREPNFETLEAIADYFNVDLDYLMGKSEIENRAQFMHLEKTSLPFFKTMKSSSFAVFTINLFILKFQIPFLFRSNA